MRLSLALLLSIVSLSSLYADPVGFQGRTQPVADGSVTRWERDYENSDNPIYYRRNEESIYSNPRSEGTSPNYDLTRGQMNPNMKQDNRYFYPDFTHNNYYDEN